MAAILPFVLLLIFTSYAYGITNATSTNPKLMFPALLAFGDSTMDTGNNNFVTSVLRSNHFPYGQEFPDHIPTGRFSDGKLMPDFIASFLGIKEALPPFLDPSLSKDDLLTGVCFASAGSGYDYITNAAGGVIPVLKQLEMFKKYIAKLNGIAGREEARRVINGALFIVFAGTNDFVASYYDLKTRAKQFPTIGDYQDFIQNRLLNFVKGLYNLGARKVAIAGLPPIGCLPIQVTLELYKNPLDRSCVQEQNSDSQAYNQKLGKLLNSLRASHPEAKFAYANIYDPVMDIITQPKKYGFIETSRGCCGTGLVETALLCNSATPLCETVSQYLFWDSVHPGQVAYKAISETLFKEILNQFT